MESRDDKDLDEPRESHSPREAEPAADRVGPLPNPQVVDTEDPAIASGPGRTPGWNRDPDETSVVETSRLRGPNEAFNPNFILVPIESDRPSHARSGDEAGGEGANESRRANERRAADPDENHGDRPDDCQEPQQKHPQQGSSRVRVMLLSGLAGLICGAAGVWGYSHFFGSGKADDGKQSVKSSNAAKSSDSDENSNSNQAADSSKNKKSGDAGTMSQAEEAWMTAVKELRLARDAAKAAQHSEEQTKSVLDFLKNTLLSAGRPGDASLTAAFWAAGQGKDLSLRKAMDLCESRVAAALGDQPLVEASVREVLGMGYVNLGDSTQAVKQLERALALREAVQGASASETATCRNQLAVAYRLAGRASEGGRLFEHKTDSVAQAAALAVNGSMMLLQKKPEDAELKLRESLTIREKLQPDAWTLFDTKSMLGEALMDQNKPAAAEPLLIAGYTGMKQREATIPPADKPRLKQAVQRLVRLYEAWGKNDEAVKWREVMEMPGFPSQ